MDCPNCDFYAMRPRRTSLGDGTWCRQYKCPDCGFRFSTVEVVSEIAQEQAHQAALWQNREQFRADLTAIVNGDEDVNAMAHDLQQAKTDLRTARRRIIELEAQLMAQGATL